MVTAATLKTTGPLVWNLTAPVLNWTDSAIVPRAKAVGLKSDAGVASAPPANVATRTSPRRGLRIAAPRDFLLILPFPSAAPSCRWGFCDPLCRVIDEGDAGGFVHS